MSLIKAQIIREFRLFFSGFGRSSYRSINSQHKHQTAAKVLHMTHVTHMSQIFWLIWLGQGRNKTALSAHICHLDSIAFGTKENPHLKLPMIRLYQLFVFSNFDHVGEMATSGSWGVGEKVLQRQSISVDLLLG